MVDEPSALINKAGLYFVSAENRAFFVPRKAVHASARSPNTIENAKKLRKLLLKGTVDDWLGYVDPETLTGLNVGDDYIAFTSFAFSDTVDGEDPFSKRLIQIPWRVCEQAFASFKANQEDDGRKVSDRVAKRKKILDWTRQSSAVSTFDPAAVDWVECDDTDAKKVITEAIEASGDDATVVAQKMLASVDIVTGSWKHYSATLPGSITSGLEETPPAAPAPASTPPQDTEAADEGDSTATTEVATAVDASNKKKKKSAATTTVVVGSCGRVPYQIPDVLFYPYARQLYIWPQQDVVHWPTAQNEVTAAELSLLRDNRTTFAWKRFLHPETVGVMKGQLADGTQTANLFTTFCVKDAGEAFDDITSQTVLVNPEVADSVTKMYIEELSNSTYSFDSETGRAMQQHVLDFPSSVGIPKKLDVKASGWEKHGGMYISPLPKVPKPPKPAKESGGEQQSIAVVGGEAAPQVDVPEVDSKTTVFNEEDEEEIMVWTKRIKVGTNFSIVTEGVPEGYVLIHKYRGRSSD